ncbi:CLUMA_CG001332, isoform A [Clunio marinus]|uniref:CLUMA_CG001332, isoform A n=1 Tax=Clunio marinus TaxID=568069 RepID=A0A1J1HJE6_9DIPT|nr:CLUMA_CG001332, isoform A [Clunio marinus]
MLTSLALIIHFHTNELHLHYDMIVINSSRMETIILCGVKIHKCANKANRTEQKSRIAETENEKKKAKESQVCEGGNPNLTCEKFIFMPQSTKRCSKDDMKRKRHKTKRKKFFHATQYLGSYAWPCKKRVREISTAKKSNIKLWWVLRKKKRYQRYAGHNHRGIKKTTSAYIAVKK